MRRPKTLYVLADGARARFVELSAETGDFVTIREMDGRARLEGLRAELRTSPRAENRQSGTTQRHAVGPDSFVRREKEAFVHEVAERAAVVLRDGGYQQVFLAAPGRLMGALRTRLAEEAQVCGEIEKDITKSPDSSLGRWLGHLTAGRP